MSARRIWDYYSKFRLSFDAAMFLASHASFLGGMVWQFVCVFVQRHSFAARCSSYGLLMNCVYSITLVLMTAASMMRAFNSVPPLSQSTFSSVEHHPSFNTGPEGGWPVVFAWPELLDAVDLSALNADEEYVESSNFTYHSHCLYATAVENMARLPALIAARVPLSSLCLKLTAAQLREVVRLHGMSFTVRTSVDVVRQALKFHHCLVCDDVITLFKSTRRMPEDTPTETVRSQVSHARPKRLYPPKDPFDRASVGTAVPSFPPPTPSQKHIASIIDRFSRAFDRDAVKEVGCAVCEQLTLATDTSTLR